MSAQNLLVIHHVVVTAFYVVFPLVVFLQTGVSLLNCNGRILSNRWDYVLKRLISEDIYLINLIHAAAEVPY